jgi:YHS domain-containing protein
MKTKFVQCEYCQTEIHTETCALAAHTTVIDGKEYTFCCSKCADRYKKNKSKKK